MSLVVKKVILHKLTYLKLSSWNLFLDKLMFIFQMIWAETTLWKEMWTQMFSEVWESFIDTLLIFC